MLTTIQAGNTIQQPKICLDHFVSTEQLSTALVEALIHRTLEIKRMHPSQYPKVEHALISNLFFEPSTRTHLSFQVAQRHLGMEVIEFDPATSSVKKGETLSDTVLTLQALGISTVVVRSSEEKYYEALINDPNLTVSVVNGGDGSGQHPSQSLLDVTTIYEEFGFFKDLKIAIAGDLSHSRVARSNAELLYRLGAKLYFCGPHEWYDSTYDRFGEYVELNDVIEFLDVLMLLRVQHERHEDPRAELLREAYHYNYGLTLQREDRMKSSAIIMHPAPVNRDVEIADELVTCQRSRIYRQMENGMFARMAILEAIIHGQHEKESINALS
ncbi:aspartate carbamoyltransferase catalytic subunit [Aerococcaceae bacterium DSM 111020]|nr:aspartate carbamoyltransferase catalytic subunit [Aerococcaceae bacterium DSM 111020]